MFICLIRSFTFFPSEWIGLGILNLTAEQWPAHHTNCSVLVLLMLLTVQKKHSFCHQFKKKSCHMVFMAASGILHYRNGV